MPAPKPVEFRRRAVELAREGHKPVAGVARDLVVSESGLRRWMTQADIDDGKSTTVKVLAVQGQFRCAPGRT